MCAVGQPVAPTPDRSEATALANSQAMVYRCSSRAITRSDQLTLLISIEAETRCGPTHHVCAGQPQTVPVSSALKVGNRGIPAGQRTENPGAKAEFELLIAAIGDRLGEQLQDFIARYLEFGLNRQHQACTHVYKSVEQSE